MKAYITLDQWVDVTIDQDAEPGMMLELSRDPGPPYHYRLVVREHGRTLIKLCGLEANQVIFPGKRTG